MTRYAIERKRSRRYVHLVLTRYLANNPTHTQQPAQPILHPRNAAFIPFSITVIRCSFVCFVASFTKCMHGIVVDSCRNVSIKLLPKKVIPLTHMQLELSALCFFLSFFCHNIFSSQQNKSESYVSGWNMSHQRLLKLFNRNARVGRR